jgi:ADP-ribosyl-[dinitrogen reductase] hydrolase
MKYTNLISGQAIGDSFLLPYEFLRKPLGVQRLEKYGYKQSLLKNFGVTSDDTDHMLMTFKALQYSEVKDFQKSLEKSLKWWLLTFPPGIGMTTLKATLKLWIGLSGGVKSSGNGPLMRVPIVALYYASNEAKRHEFIHSSTVITHKNPDAVAASQGIGNFIAYLAKNEKLPSKNELKAILLKMSTQDPVWSKYVDILMLHLSSPLPQFLKSLNCEKQISGYIMHTAISSIYFIYQSLSPKDVFKMIIQASGDTDTIGAVVGAYLGLLNYKGFTDDMKNYLFKLESNNKDIAGVSQDILKEFWINLIVKNLISIPIIFAHGIKRMFLYMAKKKG